MNIDVSPDGETLVFDLLGDIYLLPMDGGDTVPLTHGRAWDQAPRFSSDGKSIYFVSDRKGFKNIWRLTLSTESLRQITDSESAVMGTPNWSQDGNHLLVGIRDTRNEGWDVILQLIDPRTGYMTPIDTPEGPAFDWGALTRLRPTVEVFSGVQSDDGRIYFSEDHFDSELGRTAVRLHAFDLKTQAREVMTPSSAPYSDYKPQLSHDGNLLAYFRQYGDRRTEIRIFNRRTSKDQALSELTNADDASYGASYESRPNYAFTPDDRQLVFWHAGKIHRLSLDDGSSQIIPFHATVKRKVWERALPAIKHFSEIDEATTIRWPSVSRDGQTMAFAAIGYVWLMDLQTGGIRRLTRSNDFEYMPALAPDGNSVAYISFTQSGRKYGSGHLMIAPVNGGAPRQVLAGQDETFLLPNWSRDSEKIALMREVESSGGIEAVFGWTEAANGKFHEVAPAPASDEWLSAHVYARFVGFDERGRNLLFSYPTSRNKIALFRANLDGTTKRTLAIGSSDVGGIVPAPDLRNLVLTRRDGTIWTVPFDTQSEPPVVSTSAVKARRVGDSAGYYVAWSGSDLITYGFGKNVYRYALGGAIPEVVNVRIRLRNRYANRPIAFQGARLLTMSHNPAAQSVIESGTIVIDGFRISAVGPVEEVEIPSHAVVIDVTGKTIMPGLDDSHYHRIGGSDGARGTSAFKLPNPEFSDMSAIAYGVTTAWEPGGVKDDGAPATADLRDAGRILGPRWSHSARGNVGDPSGQLTSYAAALAAVQRRQALGVDVLKEYNTPTRQQRQWLSAAAHENGLGIVSHIESFDGMMTRVVDGYTGGDHSYIPIPFYKDVREVLRLTGYIWTPNITITGGSLGGHTDVKRYCWQHIIEKRPWELNKLESIAFPDRLKRTLSTKPSTTYQTHRASRVAEQAAAVAKAGVNIGVSAHNMPAVNLHCELWLLWRGGLPIEDVLRAATIGNAEKLGLQGEIGSLKAGKTADILVLNRNPLKDIINSLSIKYTVQGGMVYDSTIVQTVHVSRLGKRKGLVGGRRTSVSAR